MKSQSKYKYQNLKLQINSADLEINEVIKIALEINDNFMLEIISNCIEIKRKTKGLLHNINRLEDKQGDNHD